MTNQMVTLTMTSKSLSWVTAMTEVTILGWHISNLSVLRGSFMLCFSLLYGAYLMDYHWDHLCLLITLLSCTNYDSLPIVTHTSTPTSSIWLVTWTDSLLVLLLVVSVAFLVPVLVVSAWRLVVLKLYQ
jgi:hypothetical protein